MWESRNNVKINFEKDVDIVSEILNSRGISDHKRFLNPSSDVLHDPYLLKNIVEVCEKILDAIKQGKRIAISADCDSDGVFSTGFMTRYLRQFTNNYYVIYNQRSNGHGIENQLDYIQDGTDLLIILDSSTNSTDACKILKDKGIDIVILDHHDFEQENPHALIINPKLDDYPNKHLSGVGVVYKVVQVLDDTLGSGTVDDFIDLVACGMYADMMDVSVLENRYLIMQGMQNINNVGLEAILKLNNIEHDKINSQTIGFTISPMINGAARKDRIELGIQLLLSDDFEECLALAAKMKLLNEERRQEEKEIYERYLDKVNPNDKIIVVIDEQASKNYNGLVANKLSQEFKRPAIVMRDHEGNLAGSFRSYGNFDMKGFLNDKSIRKYIKYAVGHDGAGGIGLSSKNFKAFMEKVNVNLKNKKFSTSAKYDVEIESSHITTKLVNEISKIDYLTGQGFPVVNFLVKDLFVGDSESDIKVMGKNKDTVKIMCDGVHVIKFKTNDKWASDIGTMDTIEVIGQLSVNEWKKWSGEVEITNQVIAEDYRIV